MGFRFEKDVPVAMSDGTKLMANVWRPDIDGPVPALLVRHGYGKDGIALYGAPTSPDIFALMDEGYAVVVQDTRGAAGSEGEFAPFRPDIADGGDTVRWVVEQSWCDGNVGMWGASYSACTAWQAAASGAEGLKAISPSIGSGDVYGSPWYTTGGALSMETLLSWSVMMASVRAMRGLGTGDTDPADLVALGALAFDRDALLGTTPVADRPLMSKHLPWFSDVLAHPARDEFWTSMSAIERADQMRTPGLTVTGWYDFYVGDSIAAYNAVKELGATAAAREGQRLVVGPWSHNPQSFTGVYRDRNFGPTSGMLAAQLSPLQLAFFDYHLKGNEEALDAYAPVRLFVMGIDQWRDEQDWPLPDTSYVDFHLGCSGRANTAAGDGTLADAASGEDAVETFLYDPRRPVPTIGGFTLELQDFNGPADQSPIDARDDILFFTTEVLERPTEVTGHVSLKLFVSSSAVDTDFTAKLVDVFPDGRKILICEGMQRMRYRESRGEERMMTPGEIYEITIDMAATSNVFFAGHRIRLELSSSSFPRFDRNSNTGGVISQERLEDMAIAVNHVHHGPAHPSRLTLPLIAR